VSEKVPRVCCRMISPLVLQQSIYNLRELDWMMHGASMGTREIQPQNSLKRLKVLKQRQRLSLGLRIPGKLRSRTGGFPRLELSWKRGSCQASPRSGSEQRIPSERQGWEAAGFGSDGR